MKNRLTRPRPAGAPAPALHAPRWRVLLCLGLSTVALALGHGCGRSGETPEAAVPEPAEPSVSAGPAQPGPHPGAPPGATQPTPAVDLQALTQAVRRYGAERRRVPANLDEVVAAGYIQQLPPPPPGMRYAIEPKRLEVILVKP